MVSTPAEWVFIWPGVHAAGRAPVAEPPEAAAEEGAVGTVADPFAGPEVPDGSEDPDADPEPSELDPVPAADVAVADEAGVDDPAAAELDPPDEVVEPVPEPPELFELQAPTTSRTAPVATREPRMRRAIMGTPGLRE
jgi:hypothetical protein